MTNKGGQNGLATQIDFDFRENLRDTIILLGGKEAIADMLVKSQDGFINEGDITALRNYNVTLFMASKTRHSALKRLRHRISSQP